MRRSTKIILCALAVCGATALGAVAACTGEETPEHEHTYQTSGWTNDDDYHWHGATCGHSETEAGVKDKAAHTWDEGRVTESANHKETGIMTYTCTVCGRIKEEEIEKVRHEYEFVYKIYNPVTDGDKENGRDDPTGDNRPYAAYVWECSGCGDISVVTVAGINEDYPILVDSVETLKIISPLTMKNKDGKTIYFRLENDIDFADAPNTYINRYGYNLVFDGNGHAFKNYGGDGSATLSSADWDDYGNHSLFFEACNVVVKNLDIEYAFEHNNGTAGSLIVFGYGDVKFENIELTGTVLFADGWQNVGLLMLYCGKDYFTGKSYSYDVTFENIVNYATLQGGGYNTVFVGYPLAAYGGSMAYTFKNVVNNGNIVCKNAAMLFANLSQLQSFIDESTFTGKGISVGGVVCPFTTVATSEDTEYSAIHTITVAGASDIVTELNMSFEDVVNNGAVKGVDNCGLVNWSSYAKALSEKYAVNGAGGACIKMSNAANLGYVVDATSGRITLNDTGADLTPYAGGFKVVFDVYLKMYEKQADSFVDAGTHHKVITRTYATLDELNADLTLGLYEFRQCDGLDGFDKSELTAAGISAKYVFSGYTDADFSADERAQGYKIVEIDDKKYYLLCDNSAGEYVTVITNAKPNLVIYALDGSGNEISWIVKG